MPKYHSRINITVSSPEIWKRFKGKDEWFSEQISCVDSGVTTITYSSSWNETELKEKVSMLAGLLDEDGIVIADTHNNNEYDREHCIFYLGDSLRIFEFNYDETPYVFSNTDIADIPKWLNYGEYRVSDNEKKQLYRCRVISIDGSFRKTSIDLEEKIYLRETSFEGRPEIIANSYVSEEVFLVQAGYPTDRNRLEVKNELGSLGYLPSDVGDVLTPFLDDKRLIYTATIVDMVKLSQRNKHARSSFVAINIDANISDKPVPIKDSVSSVDRVALAEEEKKRIEARNHHK